MIWPFKKMKLRSGDPLVTEVDTRQPDSDPTPQTSHLKEYLDYYRKLENPQYAVLVTGDWGVGKTFQVRNVLPKDACYYVSLFGLSSADDVVAAIYAAMFPKKASIKKLADHVGDATAEIPGIGSLAVSGLTSALVGAFLREQVETDKPIVFDDLERSNLNTKDILGIINLYVEHHGCRVVVIAHDAKLADEFKDMKEKVIGQTLIVKPNITAAFDAFCEKLENGDAKSIIVGHREDIIGVFSNSPTKSLRILRDVVRDLARLVGQLSGKYTGCNNAMVELVRLFTTFDIEWRTGGFKESDFRNRARTVMGGAVRSAAKAAEALPLSGISAAATRYKTVDVTSTLLQDDVLCQTVIEGIFEKDAIEASLDANAFFIKPQESAPWQIVIAFDKLDDAVVERGLAEMEGQFNRREVLESGELLHIFALRMMLSTKGILKDKLDAIIEQCKRYIDDLLASGKLPPRPLAFRWADDLKRSAFHMAYWVTEDYQAQFDEVFEYLVHARNRALESQFPLFGAELLALLRVDGERFMEQVCYTNRGDNKFAAIPVLASLDPSEFVMAWMQSPKSSWYWISRALVERYNGAHVEEVTKPEAEWYRQVRELLSKQAEKSSALAKLRIQRILPK